MKYTVVLTAEFPRVASNLLAGEFDVIEHPTESQRTEDELSTLLAEADAAIILLSDPLTRQVLEANPNLRMVANFAVGFNNVDLDAARDHEVVITNTPGVLTEATADLTLALILAITRRLVEGDSEVRTTGRCIWEPTHLLGDSLKGKTLGILGMGRIGSAVAERARAFGMHVRGIGRSENLDDLLPAIDILSIHIPLSAESRHLINHDTLSRMKRGSYLINTARGAIVDEIALCDALDAGHLRGAALDVYEREPEVQARLIPMKNVILSPHIGSATTEARNAMATIAATEVRNFLTARPVNHRVV